MSRIGSLERLDRPAASVLICLFLGAWFPAAAVASEVPKGWREFVSVQGNYVAYYPPSWSLLAPDLSLLYISSFRPPKAVKGVIVPENGATINIAPAPSRITSVDSWIAKEGSAHSVRSRRSFTIPRPEPGLALHVTELLFDSVEGPNTASWYFELSGHLLVANLSYWRGDKNEGKYRQVLLQILRVLAPRER